MPQFLRRSLALLGVCSLMMLSACGGDDDGGGGGSDESQAARLAASQAAIAVSTLAHGAASLAYSVTGEAPVGGPFLGAWGLTCPDASVSQDGGFITVTFDYGTGCASQLDKRTHSGQITMAINVASRIFNAGFSNYKVDGFSIDGIVSGQLVGNQVMTNIQGLSLAKSGVLVSTVGTINVTPDNNGTLTTILDDTFSTEFSLLVSVATTAPGGGVMPTAAEPMANQNFSVFTDEVAQDPVVFLAGCKWPVSGTATVVREAEVYPQFDVDFGDGVCDDKAYLLLPPDEDPIEFTLGF